MSKSKRDLTAEETTLWRRVAATVKSRRKLPAPEPAAPPSSKPASARTAAPPPPKRAPAPSAHATPAPPQNRSAEKRVRRGDVAIDAKIDLHGHTQDSAQAALSRFLHRAHQRGDRAVLVVTGAGRGGEGVLKRRFPDWLAARDVRTIIAGYSPAHRTHGGAGAFYVFVKRSRS